MIPKKRISVRREDPSEGADSCQLTVRERWNIPLLRSNLEPNSSDHCCTVERTVEQRFLLLATLTLGIGKGRVRGNGNGNVVAKSRCKVFLLCTSLHSVAPTLHYAAVRWKYPSYVFNVFYTLSLDFISCTTISKSILSDIKHLCYEDFQVSQAK